MSFLFSVGIGQIISNSKSRFQFVGSFTWIAFKPVVVTFFIYMYFFQIEYVIVIQYLTYVYSVSKEYKIIN